MNDETQQPIEQEIIVPLPGCLGSESNQQTTGVESELVERVILSLLGHVHRGYDRDINNIMSLCVDKLQDGLYHHNKLYTYNCKSDIELYLRESQRYQSQNTSPDILAALCKQRVSGLTNILRHCKDGIENFLNEYVNIQTRYVSNGTDSTDHIRNMKTGVFNLHIDNYDIYFYVYAEMDYACNEDLIQYYIDNNIPPEAVRASKYSEYYGRIKDLITTDEDGNPEFDQAKITRIITNDPWLDRPDAEIMTYFTTPKPIFGCLDQKIAQYFSKQYPKISIDTSVWITKNGANHKRTFNITYNGDGYYCDCRTVPR